MRDPIRDWLDDADDRPRYGVRDAFELALACGVSDPRQVASALLLVEEAARLARAYPVSFDILIESILDQTFVEASFRWHARALWRDARALARRRLGAAWDFVRWRT